MEATKLHNVITDAINEDTEIDLSADITNLIAHIKANQADQITTTLKKIEDNLNNSTFNRYSQSNYKILQEINGAFFFGRQAFQQMTQILNENSFNITKTVTELDAYQKRREVFISNITQLQETFDELGIEVHYYDDNTYEMGILFPDNEKENKILNLTKELNKWDSVIKTFRELVGLDVKDTEITFVNNGTLEFFTTDYFQVALCISFILERLLTLYKRILEIKEIRGKLKTLGVPKLEDDLVLKHEKEISIKEVDAIVADIFKKFASKKIEDGRLNELKIAVKGHLNYLAKKIDNGFIIEITPPEIEPPAILSKSETEENKKERNQAEKEYKDNLAKIEVVKKTVELSREIVATGKDVFKFLTAGDDAEDSQKADKKK